MADQKLSQRPAATELSDPDLFYVVQGGVSKKVTLATIKENITAQSDAFINAILFG